MVFRRRRLSLNHHQFQVQHQQLLQVQVVADLLPPPTCRQLVQQRVQLLLISLPFGRVNLKYSKALDTNTL